MKDLKPPALTNGVTDMKMKEATQLLGLIYNDKGKKLKLSSLDYSRRNHMNDIISELLTMSKIGKGDKHGNIK